MTIAICNQKGGVGKTTTTISLGAGLIARGHSVHLWDLDNSQCDLFDLAQAIGITCTVPVHLDLKKAIDAAPSDWHLIDTPPRDDAAMRRALSLADYALIPVPAEYMALRGLGRIAETVEQLKRVNLNLKMKVLVSMYVPSQKAEKTELFSLEEFSVCDTVIPRNKLIAGAPASGQTIFDYAPKSRGASAYRALVKEVELWNQ